MLVKVSGDAKKVGEELLRQSDFTITLNGNFMDNRADAGKTYAYQIEYEIDGVAAKWTDTITAGADFKTQKIH